MPLDDLDDFLAMELGAKPYKTSQQVNSLEALVLSRVQKACPPENRPNQEKTNDETLVDTIPTNEPLYQLLDLLWPILNTLEFLLDSPSELIDKQLLADQRTLLAEQLLALPEIPNLDKPGVFAAIASCMDAVYSTKAEKRLIAQTRLKTLCQALINIRQEAYQERLQAMSSFIDPIV